MTPAQTDALNGLLAALKNGGESRYAIGKAYGIDRSEITRLSKGAYIAPRTTGRIVSAVAQECEARGIAFDRELFAEFLEPPLKIRGGAEGGGVMAEVVHAATVA